MKLFDSTDWIEDACDLLHKSNFSYILLTALSDNKCRVDSHILPDVEIEEEVIRVIREEFKRLRQEQDDIR